MSRDALREEMIEQMFREQSSWEVRAPDELTPKWRVFCQSVNPKVRGTGETLFLALADAVGHLRKSSGS